MEDTVVRPAIARRQETCTVQIYPSGTITDRGHIENTTVLSHSNQPKKRRSAVTTFSRASASRLRRLLAQTRGPEGWECFGVTFTVPGPAIPDPEWRRLWNAYRRKLLRLGGVALIWRIELQERGQPHLHCVCWAQDIAKSAFIRIHWIKNLALLGPYEGPAELKLESSVTRGKEHGEFKPGWASVTTRELWPGVFEHSVKVEGLDAEDDQKWWRYLAAHTSKSKQAQLGWKGRQWGKVNGQLLDLYEAVQVELPRKAANKVYRCLKRLTKTRFASTHGRQTWFVPPAEVKRLCDWAVGNGQPVRMSEVSRFSRFKLWKKDKRELAKAMRRQLLSAPATVPKCGFSPPVSRKDLAKGVTSVTRIG